MFKNTEAQVFLIMHCKRIPKRSISLKSSHVFRSRFAIEVYEAKLLHRVDVLQKISLFWYEWRPGKVKTGLIWYLGCPYISGKASHWQIMVFGHFGALFDTPRMSHFCLINWGQFRPIYGLSRPDKAKTGLIWYLKSSLGRRANKFRTQNVQKTLRFSGLLLN